MNTDINNRPYLAVKDVRVGMRVELDGGIAVPIASNQFATVEGYFDSFNEAFDWLISMGFEPKNIDAGTHRR